MRKILSLLLLAAICYMVMGSLYNDDLKLNSSDIRSRNSVAYVEKNVTGENNGVYFGESKDLEDGSANIVSSIVVNYRSFDTLGEVTVLFVSSLGVAFIIGLAGGTGTRKLQFFSRPNFMLKAGSRMIFGFVMLFGVLMMSHGHLTPGGGFPGGSLIAAAFLLLYMGDAEFRANIVGFKVLESVMGTVYVLVGLAGLFLGLTFLENFIGTGVVGSVFSAGILPIVYVVIGLKVGAELIGVIDNFTHEDIVCVGSGSSEITRESGHSDSGVSSERSDFSGNTELTNSVDNFVRNGTKKVNEEAKS